MDRRSWPWKKKSSDKTEKAAAVATESGGGTLPSSGSQGDKVYTFTALLSTPCLFYWAF